MRYTIGDLAEIIDGDRGKNYPQQNEFFNSGYCLFLNTGNVTNQGFSFEQKQFITKEKCDILRKGKLKRGDIVYTTRGTVGNAAYYSEAVKYEHIRINSGMIIIRPNNKVIDTKFLYQILKSDYYRPYFKQFCTGSAQPQLPIKNFSKIELDIPALEIQKRIADILSAYDDLIENNQKQIKLLEEAAQRLYKEWFVDFRFPEHENTPIIDGVPMGWRTVCLDDVICKIATGLNPRKNFVLGQGTNYYVTIKNMSNNDVLLDEKCDLVNDEAIERINQRSDLRIGDLLFSGIGTIGRVYLIDIPTHNWNISESVFTMRANNLISKEYLYLLLLSEDMQSYCDQNAHGAAQRGIRMADLRAYKFVLPAEQIMINFTNKVSPIIKSAQICRKRIKYLSESRDRLLPKLMSGEIEIAEKKEDEIYSVTKKLSFDEFLNKFGFAARAKTISEEDVKAIYEAYLDDDATE